MTLLCVQLQRSQALLQIQMRYVESTVHISFAIFSHMVPMIPAAETLERNKLKWILDSCRHLLCRRVVANRTWAKCYCIWYVSRLRFVQWRVLLPCCCVCFTVVYWNWISGNSYRSDIFFALIRLKWILIVAPVMILVVTMMLVLVIGIDYPLCAAVAWFPYSFQHVRIGL
jgi:hypothetical protein